MFKLLFCFSQIKGGWCDKPYPERQKKINSQCSLSFCSYIVPFSQLFSKDTGFSPGNGYYPGYRVFHSRLHQFKGLLGMLQRLLEASQSLKTHMALQLWRMTDSPMSWKWAGFDGSGSTFAMSQLPQAMAVAALNLNASARNPWPLCEASLTDPWDFRYNWQRKHLTFEKSPKQSSMNQKHFWVCWHGFQEKKTKFQLLSPLLSSPK